MVFVPEEHWNGYLCRERAPFPVSSAAAEDTSRLRFALQAMDPICLKPSSNFLKFKGYLIVFGNYLCL